MMLTGRPTSSFDVSQHGTYMSVWGPSRSMCSSGSAAAAAASAAGQAASAAAAAASAVGEHRICPLKLLLAHKFQVAFNEAHVV